MTQTKYEQKKRECWKEFKRKYIGNEDQFQTTTRFDAFNFAFNRAYDLGKGSEVQSPKITEEDSLYKQLLNAMCELQEKLREVNKAYTECDWIMKNIILKRKK